MAKPTRAISTLGAAESGPGVIAWNEQRHRYKLSCSIDCFFSPSIIEGPPSTVLAGSRATGHRVRIGLASTLYFHPGQLMAPPI
jgi:hypothetical protein